MQEITELVQKIKNLSHPKQINPNFPDYIHYIQFPFYKNIEEDTRIDFLFPLTVFVGQNGCGKSSALQALYGCPLDYSTSDFWFSTELDPIVETGNNKRRNSYFYGYFNSDAKKEVQFLKCRIKKKKKLKNGKIILVPDYWEPSRRIAEYGMAPFTREDAKISKNKTRWDGISKNVLYINFRAELSAFDQYFYFGEAPRNRVTMKTKQDKIRKRTNDELVLIFDGTKGRLKRTQEDYSNSVVELSDEEIVKLHDILGKDYKSGRMVQHRCFDMPGYSVKFNTDSASYSEAFAGSGETSAVRLVHRVLTAPEHSLILLDEPEVSLHPEAQKRLMCFLLEQIKEKRHQIIICTHAPAIIENLPNEAIKVFFKSSSGKFRVAPSAHPQQAFVYMGSTLNTKIKVIVEDHACKLLCDAILDKMDYSYKAMMEIVYYNGGAGDIWKEAVFHSRNEDYNSYVLFDGDKNTMEPLKSSSEITTNEIDGYISEMTGIQTKKFTWRQDSGEPEQKIDEKKKFIDYCKRNVFFLPAPIPEEIILNTTKHSSDKYIIDTINPKDKIKEIAQKTFGTCDANDINCAMKMLLQELDFSNGDIKCIMTHLEHIGNNIPPR